MYRHGEGIVQQLEPVEPVYFLSTDFRNQGQTAGWKYQDLNSLFSRESITLSRLAGKCCVSGIKVFLWKAHPSYSAVSLSGSRILSLQASGKSNNFPPCSAFQAWSIIGFSCFGSQSKYFTKTQNYLREMQKSLHTVYLKGILSKYRVINRLGL